MDKDTLVSIIIPTYNRINLIEETIASALTQDYKNIEVIVSDNFSTDGTWELLLKLNDKYPRLKIFRNSKNLGPVANWVESLKYCQGKYIKVLWSDDLIDSSFVSKALCLMNNGCGFVYSKAKIFPNVNRHSLFSFRDNTGIYDTKKFLELIYSSNVTSGRVPYSPGCALFKTEDVKIAWDYDLLNKLPESGFKKAIGPDVLLFLISSIRNKTFGYINEPLAFFRDHKDSISTIASKDLVQEYQNYKNHCLKKLNISLSFVTRIWFWLKMRTKQ